MNTMTYLYRTRNNDNTTKFNRILICFGANGMLRTCVLDNNWTALCFPLVFTLLWRSAIVQTLFLLKIVKTLNMPIKWEVQETSGILSHSTKVPHRIEFSGGPFNRALRSFLVFDNCYSNQMTEHGRISWHKNWKKYRRFFSAALSGNCWYSLHRTKLEL